MAERRTGFTIEIKGTAEQQQKLGLLTGQLLRTTKRTAELRKAAKAAGGQNQQLNASLAKSELRQKNLRKRITQTTKAIQDQSSQFKKAGGSFQFVSKGIVNSFKQIGVAFGAALGARAIAGVIGGAINIFKDFQQAQADLAAVLGKTREEITGLTEDAKRLGATTVFTATQVSGLQKEFAKLGFSTQEILDATEATLDLAAATGSDLAQAATVAGKTIRGFGLDASETQRVVDVMARSFSSSALDLGKFEAAMANVAPVAKTAGFTIERTTAILGTLVDSGIEASKAGTDLRRIFIELSKRGLTLEEALGQIRNASDKNVASFNLFGQRAFASAIIMADSADKAELLEQKLNNAGGAAQEMADVQLDTLNGELKILKSTWEGFILSLEDGSGTIQSVIRDLISFAKNAIITARTFGTRIELLRIGLRSLIGVSTEFSKDVLQDLLAFGLTEAGNKVSDLLSGIKDLGKEEIRSGEATRNFVKLLEAEGESRKDAIQLVNFALNLRLKEVLSIEAVAKAKRDSIKGEEDLTGLTTEELEKREKARIAAEKKRIAAEKKARADAKKELEAAEKELDQIRESLQKDFIDTEIARIQDDELQKLVARQETFDQEIFDLEEQRDRLVEIQRITEEDLSFELEELNNLQLDKKALFEQDKNNIEKDALEQRNKDKKKANAAAKKIDDIRNDQILESVNAVGAALGSIGALFKQGTTEQKFFATAQASINTFLAATQVLSDPKLSLIAKIAGSISIIANGLATVARINSVKFAGGGVLDGPSHSQGGIPFTIDGRGGFEAEGGEVLLTKNVGKSPTGLRMASNLNQAFGGKRLFQGGGAFAPQNILPRAVGQVPELLSGAISREEAVGLITEGVNAQQITVSETDISDVQARVEEINRD